MYKFGSGLPYYTHTNAHTNAHTYAYTRTYIHTHTKTVRPIGLEHVTELQQIKPSAGCLGLQGLQ